MFRAIVVMLLSLTLLVGVIYPVVVTCIAQLLFAHQANGSLAVAENGNVYGSFLIGQEFKTDSYFWGRPSATAGRPYNMKASGASNLAYGSKQLRDLMQKRVQALGGQKIPMDLVTASGSGLDPHISIEAAEFQISRVAHARGLEYDHLIRLVELATIGKQFGFLGEPQVNVLKLNLLLDKKALKN
ncbi:MAG: potassium-transporting ATPase subunit KdpC [Rickettsiales bacterium]